MTHSAFKGFGGYLPKRNVSNDDLAALYNLDTSDEWIKTRTGIASRHLASDEETTSEMAFHACVQALENASLNAGDIDAIIVATTTPDHAFPAVAARLQYKLNATKAFAFDVQAVCAGFIYALSVADQFIKTKQASNILVVGADKMSGLVDWHDRSTCVLFGDGAGAVVLQATNESDLGILSTHLATDGSAYEALYVGGEAPSACARGSIQMEGRKVFMHAVRRMSDAVLKGLEHNGLSLGELNLLIPHQANQRIIDGLADQLNLDASKVVSTVENHANTSAASIPLALFSAYQEGRVKIGSKELIALTAIGGGLSWGSVILRL